MPESVHRLSIPSSTRHLGEVRRFVEDHARQARLREDDIEHFKIAVDEACTNIIKHAYLGEDQHQIDLDVIVDEDRFTVRIRDDGRAFHPSMYTEPNIFKFAETRRAGGFGVHIMKRFMDKVEFQSNGNVNEVRLTKFRNGQEDGA